MIAQKRIKVEAPAKINLYLRIIGRRPDGYHDIDSVMQKLSLHDVLTISLAEQEDVRLSCPGSDLPEDDNNLVFQAADTFLKTVSIKAGVDIVLLKRIPIAAGLGGGSSDAGAVIRGMNALFGTGLGTEELITIAAPLGADVPFFVTDYGAAHASGIGEILNRAESLQNCWILLVNPGFPVSTKWVYDNFALTTGSNPYILRPETKQSKNDAISHKCTTTFRNDLESVTIDRYPEIGGIKDAMQASGAVDVLMSGSGPTVFGLFAKHADAVRCFERFRQRYDDNVFITRPLTDNPQKLTMTQYH
ncbi:MAG: 4-(cytidine 5'-diphospho)-2-C-methyl-D-erythritol kinase [Desulfobulbaceae bacterium]|nr:4-(cytidine 5'-diphospho)-2-C-methyl-D-erythritol kinase [Desulfobulbaceae bacterium]